jgi:carboxyl-terminal processing protease
VQRLKILLLVAVAACSAKAPTPGPSESRQPIADYQPPTTAVQGQGDNVPPPDPREFALSQAILKLLEQEHLLHKRIDDDVSRAAYAMYVDRLDGQKMFLLKSDVDALKKHETTIDDELRSGSLDLAHEGSKIYVARVGQVEKWVAEILAGPLDHSDEEYLELDPKKVQLADTEQELRDRWRKRIELEVMERVGQMEARLDADKKAKEKKLPKVKDNAKDKDAAKDQDDDDDKSTLPVSQIPPTPEAREAKAKADLAKSYNAKFTRLSHPGPFDAASDFVNAITSALDPHTNYLPPADKANFDIHMSGSLEGIGAVLREKDDYIEIVEIVPGGAAWRQGKLAQGDLILSVTSDNKDPVDVEDMRIDDVVKMIRGPKGTKVTLRVQKSTGTQESVTVTRDVVVVEETYARGAILQKKGGPAYGYINLPSFYGGKGPGQRTAAGDVKRLLTELRAHKVAGVIIDIRGDGGGLLGDAIEITGSLIDRGPVVQVQDSRGHRDTLSDDHPGTDYDGPVVVMVDRFSASASEILAGALQDYHRAVIVGTSPTHGKGTVQTLADLDRLTGGKIELGVLKITIQQFFRVSGASTQREGVTPDVVLPDPSGYLGETGERELEHAIPWSQIPAAKHDDWPATWKANVLSQKSTARVAKDPVLAKVAAVTQVLKARRNDTRVPLQKSAWETRRKEQKTALDAASPDTKAGPARFTVKSIDEPQAPVPTNGGKADDRLSRWRDNLAKDAFVDESLNVLGDMTK